MSDAYTYSTPPAHWSGGQKMLVKFRQIGRTYTEIRVTRDYEGPRNKTLKGVALPLSQVQVSGGNCLGQIEVFVPLWLYRKVLPQLVAE